MRFGHLDITVQITTNIILQNQGMSIKSHSSNHIMSRIQYFERMVLRGMVSLF